MSSINNSNEYIAFYKKLVAQFVLYKQAQGFKYKSNEESLNRFIKFLIEVKLIEYRLSKELVEAYSSKRPDETPKNHANRVSDLKQFVIYLNELGYEAYIPTVSKFSRHLSSFVPYIFTHDEILRIFKAVDKLKPNSHYNSAVVYPVLIRMLYGCGLRISEALDLKVGDVDLVNGILTIKKSKFDKDRLIPMSESLHSICQKLYNQIHKNSNENDYFFKNKNGSRRSKNTVTQRFREILWESGIPYNGKGKGPRLHDTRHSFCCHTLKALSDKGIDLYCALPILSTYIGHSSIKATEKYIRLIEEVYPDIINHMSNTTLMFIRRCIKLKPTDFAYYLTNFLSKYLPGIEGCSANTVSAYRDTFKLLLVFAGEKEGVREEKLKLSLIDKDFILRFLLWIEKERGCAVITRNQRLAAIHAFYSFLQKELPEQIYQFQEILSIPFKKHPQKTVNFLSSDGIKVLLAEPDIKTESGRKHLVLLSIMYATGARVQEIADLIVSDIMYNGNSLVKLTGKGNKSRFVPLEPPVVKLLIQYLEDFSLIDPSRRMDFLFKNHSQKNSLDKV